MATMTMALPPPASTAQSPERAQQQQQASLPCDSPSSFSSSSSQSQFPSPSPMRPPADTSACEFENAGDADTRLHAGIFRHATKLYLMRAFADTRMFVMSQIPSSAVGHASGLADIGSPAAGRFYAGSVVLVLRCALVEQADAPLSPRVNNTSMQNNTANSLHSNNMNSNNGSSSSSSSSSSGFREAASAVKGDYERGVIRWVQSAFPAGVGHMPAVVAALSAKLLVNAGLLGEARVHLEEWLVNATDDLMGKADGGYERVVEIYILQILAGLRDWVTAREFLRYNKTFASEKIESLLAAIDQEERRCLDLEKKSKASSNHPALSGAPRRQRLEAIWDNKDVHKHEAYISGSSVSGAKKSVSFSADVISASINDDYCDDDDANADDNNVQAAAGKAREKKQPHSDSSSNAATSGLAMSKGKGSATSAASWEVSAWSKAWQSLVKDTSSLLQQNSGQFLNFSSVSAVLFVVAVLLALWRRRSLPGREKRQLETASNGWIANAPSWIVKKLADTLKMAFNSNSL